LSYPGKRPEWPGESVYQWHLASPVYPRRVTATIQTGRRNEEEAMKLIRPGFVVGFASGYVLGARAGRERYEQIQRMWGQLRGSPTVQRAAERTKEAAAEGARRSFTVVQHGVEKAGSAVKERLHREDETTDYVVNQVSEQSGYPPSEGPDRPKEAFGGDTR
jgi:hypothetical protein